MEYAIEYGNRFQTVMATTPHRLYMGQLGVLLAVGILLAGVLALSVLIAGHVRLERVRRRLPSRYRRYLTAPLPSVPLRSVGATMALLFVLQTVTYFLQENLETLAFLNSLPGLAVLAAPQHTTVIPLQLLIAACGSLVLSTVSAWLHRSRQTIQLARVLVALYEGPPRLLARPAAPRSYIPSLRLRTGSRGLRSPPELACNVIAPFASR
jgi:hypothetical protein